ncbi:MAG: hypothetical protein U0703_24910 [Anaerolineae bacterium]
MNETMEQEQSLERLRETIREREQELQTLQRKLTDHEGGLADLKREVISREQALSLFQTSLAEHQEALAALKNVLTDQESAAKVLRASQSTLEHDASFKVDLAQMLANAAYDALFVLDDTMHVVASNTSAETLFNDPDPAARRWST